MSGKQNNGPPNMSMSCSSEPVTVTLRGKRDFADVNIRTLRWGGYPDSPVSSQASLNIQKGERTGRVGERDERTEAEVRVV